MCIVSVPLPAAFFIACFPFYAMAFLPVDIPVLIGKETRIYQQELDGVFRIPIKINNTGPEIIGKEILESSFHSCGFLRLKILITIEGVEQLVKSRSFERRIKIAKDL